MGRNYWQREFPHVFRAEKGGCDLWKDALPLSCSCAWCCCSIDSLLLSHKTPHAGGLRKVFSALTGQSWGGYGSTPSLWFREQSKLPFPQHHPVPPVQLCRAYTQAYRHSTYRPLTQAQPALHCKNSPQHHLHLSGILQAGQQSRNPTRKDFSLGQVFEWRGNAFIS